MKNLINDLNLVKNDVKKILEERKSQLDPYDLKALLFVIDYLDKLIFECKESKLKPRSERYCHLSRLLADRDQSVFSSDLSDKLIQVEKKYINHKE